jgi:AmiR/NasT family two-component response regulator
MSVTATEESTGVIRVLLADDELQTRETITDTLGALGHIVVAAVGTGADAVTRTARELPDAVLLDVHMPDGSGIDAARAISRENPGVAVILFTGDESLQLTEQDADETSAVAFLQKPTPPRVLDTQLRLAVKRARAIQEARSDAAQARAQLEQRKIIERAKGILMRRTGSSEQEAYRILQRTSQDRSVPMVEIAKAVLQSEPGLAR